MIITLWQGFLAEFASGPMPGPMNLADGRKGWPAFLESRLHLVRFAAFAIFAIVLNLCSQNAVLVVLGSGGLGIYIAILFGNASGLLFKYIADKHWVFD